MAVQPIPEGFHTLTPYLVIEGAAALMDFLKQVFDATEVLRSELPNGLIVHAQLKIGTSMIMVSEATPEYPAMPAMLFMYVEDADAVYNRAIDAGAVSLREMKDEHYGDRMGGVRDQFGNQWWIATHIADMPQGEPAAHDAA